MYTIVIFMVCFIYQLGKTLVNGITKTCRYGVEFTNAPLYTYADIHTHTQTLQHVHIKHTRS